MKAILSIFLVLLVVVGCSNLGDPAEPAPQVAKVNEADSTQHWSWGMWTFHFSVDHSKLEVVPVRNADYHYCVTGFLETAPCTNCLATGKPNVQPDGTVKLYVTLRHPFPNAPRYTGFDVRGMVYFPATSIYQVGLWERSHFVEYHIGDPPMFPYPGMPISYSRADEGGGEVLNADGNSFYLIPGINYSDDWPIFSYYPGKHGNDPIPEPASINPYKLFASDTERRMFRVSDVITREYHFALPPGEFNFGYAVDASWAPPITTPVIDPAVDFSMYANAEDPWLIEYEQLLPLSYENKNKEVFSVTVHSRGTNVIKNWGASVYCWDLSTWADYNPLKWQYAWGLTDYVDPFTTTGNYEFGDNGGLKWDLIPGHHLGVLLIRYTTGLFDQDKENTELSDIYGVKFVDIYVE